MIKNVSIKINTRAYGSYRAMANKMWFALAEYVDNALQSYLTNRVKIENIEGRDFKFEINITFEKNKFIKIRDNAAGIDKTNFIRAFEPANIPLDISGLSEYGMGMKIASIWFADDYTVISKHLGESEERTVHFDLNKVIKEGKEELVVDNRNVQKNEHYTELILTNLSTNAPNGNPIQMNKIKDHLASIYRKFINSGQMILKVDGLPLIYEEPKILFAPEVNGKSTQAYEWKKLISFEAGKYKVHGFIGLLHEMSQIHSGISLFRRGRVIQGSHDKKYHPKIISGSPGSPRDKRLFGDLELEGFDVSFEKGSFRDTQNLDDFLDLIKDELSDREFNLLRQGDKYRKGKPKETKKKYAKSIAKKLEKTTNELSALIEENDFKEEEVIEKKKIEKKGTIDGIVGTDFSYDNVNYKLEIELVNLEGDRELYHLYPDKGDAKEKYIRARINLDHTFFEKYSNTFKNENSFYPIVAIFQSLILSEIISRTEGTIDGGNIRTNFNKILSKL